MFVFYPDKFNSTVVEKNLSNIVQIIRIKLPDDLKGKYTHRDYLGAVIKLGIERKKIGDIVVDNNGAILESGTQNGIQTSGELVITGGDAVFTNNKASGIAGISAGSKLTIDAGKSGKILFENNTSQQSTAGLYSMGSVTTLTADLISFKNNVQTKR